MKKQLFILCVLLLVCLTSLSAATLEQIIEGAKENSTTYQTLLLTKQNELLSAQATDEEKKVGISIDVSANPIEGYGTEEMGVSLNPSVSITLPNDGSTTFTGSSTVSTKYGTGTTTANGSLSVSHTFTFNGYDSNYANTLEETSSKYQAKINEKQTEYSFEKTVISTISQLLTVENSFLQSQFEYEKQKAAMEKIIGMGVEESSEVYTTAKEALKTYLEAFAALDEQFSTLLANYRAFTGLEWDGVEIDSLPTLEIYSWEEGNSAVKIQELGYESSYEAYKKAVTEANKSTLAVQLSASADTDKTLSVSGDLSYTSKNWSVSVAPGVSINETEVTPSVTISGHWSNDTDSSQREISTALNNAKIAQNTYIEALASYSEECLSLIQQIIQWDSQKEQKQAALQSKKTLLENAQNMFDLGLSTEEDLREAKINYKVAENEWKALLLEGLSLQHDLEIFAI